MRIARFSRGDAVSFGVIDGDPAQPDSLSVTAIAGHPFAPFQLAGEPTHLSEVRLLAPVLPSKVVGVGKNYAEHAREMGGEAPPVPPIFLKPSTSVIGPQESISLPHGHGEVHHEAELAIVIGRLCRDVPVARAHEVILGFTCGNDVTDRDLQKSDGQWARAKGADTYCPLGPWIDTTVDPADLRISATVNGEVRQDGTTADLLTGVSELVALVSAAFTLLPGDVILTGTPAGVGRIDEGDEVAVSIEGIGTLSNRVVARA
ncbi:2-keto-4-pentenoate hydratase/2-oxohepta-3-ene-1,7-dioic acid hydratase in catechol pathway [Motilibacter rhizosphaerae]|uniref:2-keto-4-pentenoate hydratase/2-oxohepta-3-ene-1,7-dioic acid hydratase in catechol pathway n=1 Tax=Motilibacter rhizosphaerae TaxID=598652 RepID=A0A4Q7NPX1_9ACTN|nr:fumarylacetoacetate hydrolase family protein [Motilibacter rhizosphaerae]RZS87026.1 2-keto-4-pentenoate hydratase/2-oxohepta-3-ene-1,7-dioic acid hydratase in catechol pathway [Motilibacter rhizosphaerae]